MFNAIPKKTTKAAERGCAFVRWKKHKTDTTKDAERLVIRRRTVQEFIGGPI
jgi:hypothetical protein